MMQPMPRVPPFDRPATYDDLVKLPDNFIAEIVDGELHASPKPAPPHVVAGSSVGGLLLNPYSFGRGGPGGWWILDEPELHLSSDVLVPDVAGWRKARMPHRPETAYFPLAPDWVCEILSPSTAVIDRVKKLAIYAREGVAHAWLIDPALRTLEVLRLHNGLWVLVGTHVDDEVVRAEPFVELDLELRLLWAEPADASS
jgi:Uma2 family endonuclease